jgi:hypothetical protein
MSYRGIRNWPPAWTQENRGGMKTLSGEIGVLKYVHARSTPANKCVLVIEHENQSYVGTLLFDSLSFCSQLCALLKEQIGRSIQQIGDLNL